MVKDGPLVGRELRSPLSYVHYQYLGRTYEYLWDEAGWFYVREVDDGEFRPLY